MPYQEIPSSLNGFHKMLSGWPLRFTKLLDRGYWSLHTENACFTKSQRLAILLRKKRRCRLFMKQ